MHRYFPFDGVTVNGTEIGREMLVAAAMRFVSGGNDLSITTGDGQTHFIRRTVRREAVFEVFGDRRDLIAPQAVPVILMRAGTAFLRLPQALISAQFHEERGTTSVRIIEVSFP